MIAVWNKHVRELRLDVEERIGLLLETGRMPREPGMFIARLDKMY
jgi:hypothetical protein